MQTARSEPELERRFVGVTSFSDLLASKGGETMGYSYMNPKRRRPIALAARKGADAILDGSDLRRLLR